MAELQTLARPYAKAAFEHANQAGKLEAWSEFLSVLAVASTDNIMLPLLDNPAVGSSMLLELYEALFSQGLSEHEKNFLKLLVENKRLKLTPYILTLFEQHRSEAESRMEVEVISAFELTEEQKEQFIKRLQTRFGKTISLQCRQDRDLLGGAIVRAGDKVIDGSVKGRLTQMAESLCA